MITSTYTLELADLQGKGSIDIIAAEMHLGREDTPKIYIFKNDGKGNFSKETFEKRSRRTRRKTYLQYIKKTPIFSN